ncbi:unnamed protein product [Rhizoctonia solani]|uniref:Uncharacterized protein n=1 Tax=Rhizoctonia solani TaxID=456999 RepID=A0A8H3C255_9AGAM|nr:unnamed protein product [Rhizoctonia solani]
MPAFNRQEQHRARQERERLEAQKRKAERMEAHERRMRRQTEDAARARADRARRHQERVADEAKRRHERDARFTRSSSAHSSSSEYDYFNGAHYHQQPQHYSHPSPPMNATHDAIGRYKAGFERLKQVAMTRDEKLSFTDIPWPTLYPICGTHGLSKDSVKHIALSELLYPEKDRRGRLLAFLRHWHPDKFVGRWMQHICESDRTAVQEGVTMVAGIVNELLSTSTE